MYADHNLKFMYVPTGTCLLSTDGGPLREGDLWCVLAAGVTAYVLLNVLYVCMYV